MRGIWFDINDIGGSEPLNALRSNLCASAADASMGKDSSPLTSEDLQRAIDMKAEYEAINKKVDEARTELVANIAAKVEVAVMKMMSDGGKPEIVWHEGRCYVVDLSLLPPFRRNI